MANNSTGYWVEQLVIEALKESDGVTDLTSNIQHFHTDEENLNWPLVFVKATVAEQDESEIRVNGKQAEVYDVTIGAEWQLGDQSAAKVDELASECRDALDDADPDDLNATSKFFYFRPERRTKGDKEIEQNIADQPTRRVELDTFPVTVIRAS